MRPRNITATLALAAALLIGAAPVAKATTPCITNVQFAIQSYYTNLVTVTFTPSTGITQLTPGVWNISVTSLTTDYSTNACKQLCPLCPHLRIKIDFKIHGSRCDGPALNNIAALGWKNINEDGILHTLSWNFGATDYVEEWDVFFDASKVLCIDETILGTLCWGAGCTGQG